MVSETPGVTETPRKEKSLDSKKKLKEDLATFDLLSAAMSRPESWRLGRLAALAPPLGRVNLHPRAPGHRLLFLQPVLWSTTPQHSILNISVGRVQPGLRDQLDRQMSLLPPVHQAWRIAGSLCFLHRFYNFILVVLDKNL